jgi:hypothetical protein
VRMSSQFSAFFSRPRWARTLPVLYSTWRYTPAASIARKAHKMWVNNHDLQP